jgi:predicted metal-binding membrane protein
MGSSTAALSAQRTSRTSRRERWVILGGLAAITASAWVYLVVDAQRMSGGMTGRSMDRAMQSMAHTQAWTPTEFGLRLVMWAVMMVAMMAPTAAPMTLVYAAVARKAAREGRPVAPTFVFVAGYLTVWGLFSVAATSAQLGLDHLALLSPAMVIKGPWLGGAILTAAGIYELTPFKHACLSHCRAPAHFISQQWRAGTAGALRMGLQLGLYCLGCCWVLMALLFVGGIMNLLWIAAISAFVLLEKTVPFAETGVRLIGATLTIVGVAILSGVVALG